MNVLSEGVINRSVGKYYCDNRIPIHEQAPSAMVVLSS